MIALLETFFPCLPWTTDFLPTCLLFLHLPCCRLSFSPSLNTAVTPEFYLAFVSLLCHLLTQQILSKCLYMPDTCRFHLLCNIRYHLNSHFCRLVMSDSLRLHGLQHVRLPCPSPIPGACTNSCPWSQWCHPTISSSVISFSSCLQSFPASGSFPMSQFFTSRGQSIRASASTSDLPMNIQGWFPLGWTGWISLQSKGHSRVFSNTTVQKHQFFDTQLSLRSDSYIYTWVLEKS